MENKLIIAIIGASSGIGEEIANILVKNKNITLFLGSRNIKSKNNISENKKYYLHNIDVTDKCSVELFFNEIKTKFNKLDCVINCAGFVRPFNMLETTIENWTETINVNLTGTFLVNKEATKIIRNTGGRIINISSTAGLTPRPGWSAYASSKSGVIGFSRAISEELKAYNIKVFILCPGRTATPLRKILAPDEDPKTIMQPESVAKVVEMIINGSLDTMEGEPLVIRERF